MNGEPLPIEHGFPARLIVPGLYGFVSATKWLTEIELTTFAEFDHYWLRRGWAPAGADQADEPHRHARGASAKVPAGIVPIAGVAWAQTVGIAAVEVNIDDAVAAGRARRRPRRTTRGGSGCTAGRPRRAVTRSQVRATDSAGAIQTAERAEPIPDGASGHHQIVVIVE